MTPNLIERNIMLNATQAAIVTEEIRQMRQILGGKIEGPIRQNAAGVHYFGFEVSKGFDRFQVWVDRDPEGNGPGHLSITKK